MTYFKWSLAIFGFFTFCLAFANVKGEATHEIAITDTGFAITVPNSWATKKRKSDLTLTVPASKDFSGGTIQLFGIDFRGTAEQWDSDQKLIAQSMNQKVVGQSQLTILGVPLLETDLIDPSNASGGSIETGILMSASNQKLYFRMFTNSASFAGLKSAWTNALTTLRTLDGSTPVVDDPTVPLTSAQKAPKLSVIPTTINIGKVKPEKFSLGPVVIKTAYANRNIQIHLPKGWLVVKEESGWKISNPSLSYPLEMTLSSNLDSPDPTTALLTLSGKSLDLFEKVSSRNEAAGKTNKAGAITDLILRKGTDQKGKIETCEGFASVGEFYVLISQHFPKYLSDREESLIKTLFDEIGIVKESEASQ